MTSEALRSWRASRAANLHALLGVHQAVTRGLPGCPSLTAELNHALIARLASEFQGFARDLHEDGRKLDVGNANAGNLGNDFLRIGLRLWPNIHSTYPTRGPHWHEWVEWLNLARNGIAHNDPVKLGQAMAVRPLTLATFRNARGVLNQFAAAMDAVVETYLNGKTGVAPW